MYGWKLEGFGSVWGRPGTVLGTMSGASTGRYSCLYLFVAVTMSTCFRHGDADAVLRTRMPMRFSEEEEEEEKVSGRCLRQ